MCLRKYRCHRCNSPQTSTIALHKLETEKLILSRIDKIFRIERNGKQFRFLNEKQFLKAFPDHKEELKKYADDNKTDFNEIEDVLQIYNHAVTL